MANIPILLFAFNRPDHLRRTLDSLRQNAGADCAELIVFIDGPRNDRDEPLVRAVQELAERQHWCRRLEIVARERNMGCAKSIVEGVTSVCRDSQRVIVVEDDLILSPWFLQFMRDALERYSDEESIMHVSGYMFPLELPRPQEARMLPLISPWGWATWWRAWKHFDPAGTGYEALRQDENLRKKFDLGGYRRHFQLLDLQIRGVTDSWAIRWYLTVFMRDGLGVFPGLSLVRNTGFDGSGRHCSHDSSRPEDRLAEVPVLDFSAATAIDEDTFSRLQSYFAQRWP